MIDMFFLLIVIIIVVFVGFMIYDSHRFVIRRYGIKNSKIKGKFKVVIISDLHNQTFGKNNQILLDAIDKEKPEAILIAGDMLTAHPNEKFDVAISFLEKLAQKYTIYYGNGNHEHRIKLYPKTYGNMAEEFGKSLSNIGIVPLVNEKKYIKEKNLVIYGSEIDRSYYKRFKIPIMEDGYLESILQKPDKESFNILIAHNPDYFKKYARWGADLVISGHVHGGIIRIPRGKGVVAPSIRFFPEYDGGVFKEKEATMILSRGLGLHTVPFRLFNPGEFIVLELEEI